MVIVGEAATQSAGKPSRYPDLARLVRIALGRDHGEADGEKRKKPANLVYDVDERPPLAVSVIMALQHVVVMAVGWIFVVVIVTGMGGSSEQTQAMIRMAMISSGAATILQAMRRGPVGSGYLCPLATGPAYIPASILAGQTGGLPLLVGMTTASGIFEFGLSRVIHKLRVLFPPEVTGLVVAMVGVALVKMGCVRFFGYTNGTLDPRSTLVGAVTLLVMMTPTVWSKSKLRLYPVLLGLLVGYALALALGVLKSTQLDAMAAAPLVSFPTRVPGSGFAFHSAMLTPFLIASLSSVLKTVGDLTLCQKINDAHWKRTEMHSVAGGILAGSIGTTISALTGGTGQSTFSSNVGLSMATGVTSRTVALPAGLILIALAFVPKLAAVFAVVPAPVMGAVLVYVTCFMILGGLQLMTSRMLDVRRTFVLGMSIVFGLSVDMVPGLYQRVPSVVQPIFSTELSLATVLVVVLNLLFRIGVAKTQATEIAVEGEHLDETINNFMEERGGAWGMRKEVEERAAEAIYELMLTLRGLGVMTPVQLRVRFDEFSLRAEIEYLGACVRLPEAPPTMEELSDPEAGTTLLSGYIVRQRADKVNVGAANGRCKVNLQFEH
jgi:xanthine permease XanP